MSEQIPLMLYDGDLSVSTTGGKLSTITLATHSVSHSADPAEQLRTQVLLKKYSDAWELCKLLNDKDEWHCLGLAAISDLDIPFGEPN